MNFLPIAASDMDMVIGIIAVIGWIVAQILAKLKGGDKTAPPPGEAPTPTAAPQDELRKFFEEMEKTLKPQEEPKPVQIPVPPPPRPTHRPSRTQHEHVTHSVRVQTAEPAFVRETPSQTAEEAARVFMKAVERATTVPALPPLPQPPLIPEGLRDPQALRKMIVTMEVLGKPVALRSA